MQHRKDPSAAHHALMKDLAGLASRYALDGMPGIERIAVLAQFIGHEIAELPADTPYGAPELLTSVARNIEAGNRAGQGGRSLDGALVGAN